MFKILVVEDDKDLNLIVSNYLKKLDYNVTSSFNGLDALKEIEFDYSKYLDRYRLVKKYEEWQILEFGDFTHDDSNKIPVLTKRAICEMENFFKLPSSFSDEMEFLEKELL